MKIEIEITEENWKYIEEIKSNTDNLTEADIVNAIIQRFSKKVSMKKSSEPEQYPNAKIIVSYFKETYKRKFSIDTDEEIDILLIQKVIDKVNKSVEDIDDTLEILKKAIAWYIYQHDNTSKDGQRYPYKAKTLFEQDFLLKKCIEASRSIDLNMLLKSQEMNMSQKDLASAIRRGDLIGMDVEESPSVLLEKALEESVLLMHEFKLGKDFKKHPKMKELYTSNIPSLEYIKKSLKFMQSFRENVNE